MGCCMGSWWCWCRFINVHFMCRIRGVAFTCRVLCQKEKIRKKCLEIHFESYSIVTIYICHADIFVLTRKLSPTEIALLVREKRLYLVTSLVLLYNFDEPAITNSRMGQSSAFDGVCLHLRVLSMPAQCVLIQTLSLMVLVFSISPCPDLPFQKSKINERCPTQAQT